MLPPVVGILAAFVILHAMRLSTFAFLHATVAICVEIFHLIFTFGVAVNTSRCFNCAYLPSEAAVSVLLLHLFYSTAMPCLQMLMGVNIVMGLIHIALLAMIVAHLLLSARFRWLQQ